MPTFSPHSINPQGAQKAEIGGLPTDSDCTPLAQTVLVPGASSVITRQTHSPSSNNDHVITEQGSGNPSGSAIPALTHMAPEFLEFKDLNISQDCRDILF